MSKKDGLKVNGGSNQVRSFFTRSFFSWMSDLIVCNFHLSVDVLFQFGVSLLTTHSQSLFLNFQAFSTLTPYLFQDSSLESQDSVLSSTLFSPALFRSCVWWQPEIAFFLLFLFFFSSFCFLIFAVLPNLFYRSK